MQGGEKRQIGETTERVGLSPLRHDCSCARSLTWRKGPGVKLMFLLFLWCAFKETFGRNPTIGHWNSEKRPYLNPYM